METLKERNDYIRSMRQDGYTYAEIGRVFDISRQRVEQIVHHDKQLREPIGYGKTAYPVLNDILKDRRISITWLAKMIDCDRYKLWRKLNMGTVEASLQTDISDFIGLEEDLLFYK